MRKIVCPECGKELGEYVLEHVASSPLGAIPCYDSKLNYRKAAHINLGKGTLCRKCARKIFPDGVAYKVTINYVNRRITWGGGIKRSGYYATRPEAEEAVRDANARCDTNYARVEIVNYLQGGK